MADEWGRLYLESRYKERNSYPNAATLATDLSVVELLPERLNIGQFPGYKKVNLSKEQLDIIVRQKVDSRRSALSSIKGIYLITDQATGKLHVGKADGENGVWGRGCTYAITAHGHNAALIQAFGIEASVERQKDLHFSLLEIADLHAMPEEIDARAGHWKDVLMSRKHGYNRN